MVKNYKYSAHLDCNTSSDDVFRSLSNQFVNCTFGDMIKQANPSTATVY